MYDLIPDDSIIDKTKLSLQGRGFIVNVVEDSGMVLSTLKQIIPEDASVMVGASKTLEQIGFSEFLNSGKHKWKNLQAMVHSENDPKLRAELRKQSVNSDFYLGSVHALSTTGEMVIASNTGSQLPHIAFTSNNIILVVGAQKITDSLENAFKRLNEYVIPLEDERLMGVYNVHTRASKILLLNYGGGITGQKIAIIIVKEKLGF